MNGFATDRQGNTKPLPDPVGLFRFSGYSWLSRGDLLVFCESQVERWKITDDGARRVEVWKMENLLPDSESQ